MPEEDRRTLRIPKLVIPSPPAGDANAVVEAAKMLVAADNPVIVAGRVARTPNGIKLLVELAETLQADVHRSPVPHELPDAPSAVQRRRADSPRRRRADVVLGLEVPDFWNATHAQTPINRMGMTSRPIDESGREAHHDHRGRSVQPQQLPGLRPLHGSRSRDRGRRRSDAAGAHRGVQAADDARSQARRRRARHGSWPDEHKRDARSRFRSRRGRLGREPDHDGAAVGGAVQRHQKGRLVVRLRHDVRQLVAAAPLGLRQALPVHRRPWRVRHRLRRAGGRRRRARQQEARAHHASTSSATAT